MVRDKQGCAPCKTSRPRNPHDSQLLWVSTSLKVGVGSTCQPQKEGTTLHPRASKHNLQYDGRPDWCLGVQVGT